MFLSFYIMKCLLTARFIYAFTQNYRESGDGGNTFCISFSFSETICIRKPEFEYNKATSVGYSPTLL